jgi:hypothetical protein
MATIEENKEFTGDSTNLVLGILFCFPYAIYYYFDNKEQVWVCPECKENVSPGAGTCKHCSEDLSQHTSP